MPPKTTLSCFRNMPHVSCRRKKTNASIAGEQNSWTQQERVEKRKRKKKKPKKPTTLGTSLYVLRMCPARCVLGFRVFLSSAFLFSLVQVVQVVVVTHVFLHTIASGGLLRVTANVEHATLLAGDGASHHWGSG
jgi:hypothetical protein